MKLIILYNIYKLYKLYFYYQNIKKTNQVG